MRVGEGGGAVWEGGEGMGLRGVGWEGRVQGWGKWCRWGRSGRGSGSGCRGVG